MHHLRHYGFQWLMNSSLGITRCVLNAIKLLSTDKKKTVLRVVTPIVMMTMQYIRRYDICVVMAAGKVHSIKRG